MLIRFSHEEFSYHILHAYVLVMCRFHKTTSSGRLVMHFATNIESGQVDFKKWHHHYFLNHNSILTNYEWCKELT